MYWDCKYILYYADRFRRHQNIHLIIQIQFEKPMKCSAHVEVDWVNVMG